MRSKTGLTALMLVALLLVALLPVAPAFAKTVVISLEPRSQSTRVGERATVELVLIASSSIKYVKVNVRITVPSDLDIVYVKQPEYNVGIYNVEEIGNSKVITYTAEIREPTPGQHTLLRITLKPQKAGSYTISATYYYYCRYSWLGLRKEEDYGTLEATIKVEPKVTSPQLKIYFEPSSQTLYVEKETSVPSIALTLKYYLEVPKGIVCNLLEVDGEIVIPSSLKLINFTGYIGTYQVEEKDGGTKILYHFRTDKPIPGKTRLAELVVKPMHLGKYTITGTYRFRLVCKSPFYGWSATVKEGSDTFEASIDVISLSTVRAQMKLLAGVCGTILLLVGIVAPIPIGFKLAIMALGTILLVAANYIG